MSSNEFGITNLGFNPKPVDRIEEELQDNLKQNFGENVDLSSQSPLFKIVRVQSVEIAQLWLKCEDNFYNTFIQTAHGSALDLLGEDLGLIRKQPFPSSVVLTIYKNTTAQVTVPSGSLFQTLEGILFSTDLEITIPVGNPLTTTGLVNATSVTTGIIANVGINTIIQPTNTISGVDKSDNTAQAFGGTDLETDDEYRARLLEFTKSTWTPSAIRSAVLNINGVSGVKIIEYATSYDVLVVPKEIFDQALIDEITTAIQTVNPITVEFNVLEAESISIEITATVILNGITLSDAIDEIIIEVGQYISSLNIDDDVIFAKVIQAIMEVSGIVNVHTVSLVGKVLEKHLYQVGTSVYFLNYPNGDSVFQIDGILSGSPHTFVNGVDFNFSTGPAQVDWSIGGDDPDDQTEFEVLYTVPPNAYGDIEVNPNSVAILSTDNNNISE